MRAVVQRVSKAHVLVDEKNVGEIGPGMVVLLGIHRQDTTTEITWMADKLVHLRIFPDRNGKMNQSLTDINQEMLIVSQFTLYGDCRKGRRPGYSEAAPPEIAEPLYNAFIEAISNRGIRVATGQFQALMQLCIVNDGPVTLMLDSKKTF